MNFMTLTAKHKKTLKESLPGLCGYLAIVLLFWLFGFSPSETTSVIAGIAFLEANVAKQKLRALESK